MTEISGVRLGVDFWLNHPNRVLAKDRPGESDTKGGVTQDSLT